MKKTIYLAAVLAIGSLVLVGWGCAKKPAANQVVEQKNSSTEEFTGTMSDLMKRGRPVHCTYSITQDQATQNGEMFIAGTKARSDIEVVMPNAEKQNVHAIALADEQYTWGMQGNKGIKITMSLDEQQKLASESKENYQQNSGGAPDMTSKIDFKCTEWAVDNSKFEVPKDIQFQDMTDLFKSFSNSPAGGSQVVDMCKVCNSLPAGSARDACVKSSCK